MRKLYVRAWKRQLAIAVIGPIVKHRISTETPLWNKLSADTVSLDVAVRGYNSQMTFSDDCRKAVYGYARPDFSILS